MQFVTLFDDVDGGFPIDGGGAFGRGPLKVVLELGGGCAFLGAVSGGAPGGGGGGPSSIPLRPPLG